MYMYNALLTHQGGIGRVTTALGPDQVEWFDVDTASDSRSVNETVDRLRLRDSSPSIGRGTRLKTTLLLPSVGGAGTPLSLLSSHDNVSLLLLRHC